jgi:hypothetical protein
VLIATPRDGAKGVEPSAEIWVQFAPVVDGKTILAGKGIRVVKLSDAQEVKGSWKVSHGGTMFSFVPDQPLEKGREYEISLTTAAKDKAGTPGGREENPLQDGTMIGTFWSMCPIQAAACRRAPARSATVLTSADAE